jgi:hypothetical protein
MAVLRLSRPWLVASAVVALAALLSLGASMMFFVSLAESPDTRFASWPFLGAVLSSVVLVGAVPVFRSRPLPRWARIAVPLFVGVFSLLAAGSTWVLASLFACGDDGLCRPADTWKALPALIVCGILAAAGPGLAALAATPERRSRWWAGTIVTGLLGFVIALVAWVEVGIYPLS